MDNSKDYKFTCLDGLSHPVHQEVFNFTKLEYDQMMNYCLYAFNKYSTCVHVVVDDGTAYRTHIYRNHVTD